MAEAARRYMARGWNPTPVKPKTKSPILVNWQTTTLTPEQTEELFTDDRQLGIKLGKDNGRVIDLDIDNPIALEFADRILPKTNLIFGRPGNPRSHRIYLLPQDEDISREIYKDLDEKVILELRGTGHQTVFPPSYHPSGELIAFDPDCIFDEDGIPSPTEKPLLTLKTSSGMLAAATLLAQHWDTWSGKRHEVTLALAGMMARGLYTRETTRKFILLVSYTTHDHEPHDREKIVNSTFDRFEDDPNAKISGFTKLAELVGDRIARKLREWLNINPNYVDPYRIPFTDVGNANRLLNDYSESLKFDVQKNKWLIWDSTNWRYDDADLITEHAKTVGITLRQEALVEQDAKYAKTINAWANLSESANRIQSMKKLAQSDPRITVRSDEFDQNKDVLNLLNGTLNLRTGGLMPHTKEDLITRHTPIQWHPDAKCPNWLAHIDRITGGDKEYARYLQKLFGYTLTGHTREQVFMIPNGIAGTGKTVTMLILYYLLGMYARNVDPSTFMQKQKNSRANPDLARLQGVRLALSSESELNEAFATGLVKRITGSGLITAAALYQEEVEFAPNFKLWMDTNHPPRIPPGDAAAWSRVISLPFAYIIRNSATDIKDFHLLLRLELAGILVWAQEGARLWYEEGLGDRPKAVLDSMNHYQSENDILGHFLETETKKAPGNHYPTSKLYENFKNWCQDSGERNWRKRTFIKALEERGYPTNYRSTDNQLMTSGLSVMSAHARSSGFAFNPKGPGSS